MIGRGVGTAFEKQSIFQGRLIKSVRWLGFMTSVERISAQQDWSDIMGVLGCATEVQLWEMNELKEGEGGRRVSRGRGVTG
jgi:hypothetical protein